MPKQVQEAANRANEMLAKRGNPLAVEQEQEQVVEPEPVVQEEVATPQEDEWKRRFTNYKKATDKTIYDLRQSVSQSQEALEANQKLAAEVQALRQRVPNTPEEALELFSKDEVNTFKKVIASEMETYVDKINSLESQVTQQKKAEEANKAKQSHQALLSALRDEVENFDAIDKSLSFRDYLNDYDRFGNLRMDLLRKAQESRDIDRLVKFYKDYTATTVTNEQPKKTQERELQQVPRSTSMNPQQTQEVIWNNEMVTEFYHAASTGKYTPEQKAIIEADLEQAIKTGRFRR